MIGLKKKMTDGLKEEMALDGGKKYVEEQVNKGREKAFTKWFYPVCKYLYVPICILVLILGIALGGIG